MGCDERRRWYNRTMTSAARILWRSLVGLYDETFLLLRANLAWFALSLPFALPVLVIMLGFVPPPRGDESALDWPLPIAATGFLMLIVPTPASLGLYRLAAVMERRESPPWSDFLQAARQNMRLGLALYVIGVVGIVVAIVNARFYFQLEPVLLRALAFLWLYIALFWLVLQLYLGPVAMYLGERRMLHLYRRAGLLVLAQPLPGVVLLVVLGPLTMLSLLVLPLYFGLAMAFVALASTAAVAAVKRRHDPHSDDLEAPA
jgi:uncharacterized membrane protein YesL